MTGAYAIGLNPNLHFHSHAGRGEFRYVIEDRERGRLFRVGRREYLLISALEHSTTLADALARASQTSPDLEWDSRNLDMLLRWLIANQLVKVRSTGQTANQAAKVLPEGTWESRLAFGADHASRPNAARAGNTKLWDPLSFQLTLLSGQRLQALARPGAWLCSVRGAVLGCVLGVVALSCFWAHWDHCLTTARKLFVPGAQCWWILAWLVLKFGHELGHAAACVAYGAKVGRGGISFFCGAPIPYVDVTDVWKLENQWARVLCSAMGMFFELGLASMAVLVLCFSESEVLQYLSCAIMTMGTVVTLAFNANPLMKFDGYFILSDLLGRPNMWSECQSAFHQACKALLGFGSRPPVGRWFMAAYGLGCNLYRTFMLIGLAWGAMLVWQGIGVMMIGWGVFAWLVVPLANKRWAAGNKTNATSMPMNGSPLEAKSIWQNPWLRPRTLSTLGIAAGLFALCWWIPSPWQPRSPGYVDFVDPVEVRNLASGFVRDVLVQDGQSVRTGDPLLRLSNQSLEEERELLFLRRKGVQERCQALRAEGKIAELHAEEARAGSLDVQLDELQRKVDTLVLAAERDGIFLARDIENSLGRYLESGTSIGTVAEIDQLEIVALVGQAEIEAYRREGRSDVIVELDDGPTLAGYVRDISPRANDEIDNPAMAAVYDGPIAVRAEKSDKDTILKSDRARFQVRIAVPRRCDPSWLSPGQTCRVRAREHRESIIQSLWRWKDSLLRWSKPASVS